MPKPSEHKTVQARILAYAQECGWTFVPRGEAERRRDFATAASTPEGRARTATPYFGDLLEAKVREFNPKYPEAAGALVGRLMRLTADIAGNRDFLTYLRNQGKFFEPGEYGAQTKPEADDEKRVGVFATRGGGGGVFAHDGKKWVGV